ncbi:PAAR domain-containing protein [Acinetobacter tianfuensis]|uniref:PAAR domain-containing protein n=1 Tax=Acinetobacter tianfuensis TaxID=2419603 RepID=A0A3A8EC53_9GAMM|nr:PAAR domain-containing protein [Acinetobacter tianfuensis]RKG31096.1 PAAR domain-containing protein [Acinetobacter tianfuensis]
MSKALITLGAKTTHGGIVAEVESSFLINGIAVHLNGMKHFCPKCKAVVAAIATDMSTTVKGRAIIRAGDQTTCGASFLPQQQLAVSAK